MKKKLLPLLFLVLVYACEKPRFQSEDIFVTGTGKPVISLNGTWKFSMNPPADFQNNEINTSGWSDITVPGECAMQGFAIKHNRPYVYKKQVDIPGDYSGKRIKVRFEGVYSYARVWINGKFIRDHSGGFTAWDCDISSDVIPGKSAWLTVEFTDRDNDMSYASGYAKHPIGGILRGVSLMATPDEVPEAIYITTAFKKKYKDADLSIMLIHKNAERPWVGFKMYDRKGAQVRLTDRRFRLKQDTSVFTFHVKDPAKWSAEDPALYSLVTEVFNKSILTASVKTRFGFREVKVSGNKLLVNGDEIKLRGSCRHDMHPLLGRVSTPEYDLKDVMLAREANMNFIRTSHYPPSETFLRYCDEYGLYVEDESAVCFVNTHRNRFYKDIRQSGPEFLPQQHSQVREMVMSHFNHPSVIIWSLGNESAYNQGFSTDYKFIKSFDGTRPVIFSYPGMVPDSVKCYDILSLHYPSWKGDLTQYGKMSANFSSAELPVIFDEWAHVPCYNKPELLNDMNVRNFWGQSLDSMWTGVFNSDGGAGGAIWGMIDETFMLPDTMSGYNDWWGIQEVNNGIKMYEGPVVGYGEWGIVDTWRRKKPEFWNTKKAYSPIKIPVNEISGFKAWTKLEIPVINRFDHTNLNKVITEWRYRGKWIRDRIWNIGPHSEGIIQLRPSDWTAGETVHIRFLSMDSALIDEYSLRLGKREPLLPEMAPEKISIDDDSSGKINFETSGIRFVLDRKTGIMEDMISGRDTIIKSGPWLNLRYIEKDHWSVRTFNDLKESFVPESVTYDKTDSCLNISVSGHYDKIHLTYNVVFSGGGTFCFTYSADNLPVESGIEEAGMSFLTGSNYLTLNWERDAYWNAYPDGHQGSSAGNAVLDSFNDNIYRMQPGNEWALDNKSFYYNGTGRSADLSFLASSLKENILLYNLATGDNNGITVLSNGSHACRIRREGRGYRLYIDQYWDYTGIGWGNYFKNQSVREKMSDSFTLLVK